VTRHPETRRSATESIDTKSPDQYVAQQLTATTTHELFKCPIAPSLHVAVVKSHIAPSVVAVVKFHIAPSVVAVVKSHIAPSVAAVVKSPMT